MAIRQTGALVVRWQWSKHTDPGHCHGWEREPGCRFGQGALVIRKQKSTHTDPGLCLCGWERAPIEGKISPVDSPRWSWLPVRTKSDNLKLTKTLIFSIQDCPELQGKLFVCRSWKSWEIEMTLMTDKRPVQGRQLK